MPNHDSSNLVTVVRSRSIFSSKKCPHGSKNWKWDWAKWSGKYLSNPKPEITPPNQNYTTRTFTRSLKMSGTTSKAVCQNSRPKDPVSGNNSISKGPKWGLTNLCSVASSDSIPLYNRFNIMNNTVLFPENVCESTNHDQKTVCLHSKQRSVQACVNADESKVNVTSNNEVNSDGNDKILKLAQQKVQGFHDSVQTLNQDVQGECPCDSSSTENVQLRRRRSVTDGQNDKYDLDLRFRPRHRDKIVTAQDCVTFQKWDSQNSEKFGFIPLGDLMLPSINLKNITEEKIFDVHRRIKASGTFNFMKSQIQISSQLKADAWERHLQGYWDSQLLFLIRYGFPLDFDYSTPLQSVDKNHTSANQFTEDIQAYITEEQAFGAMLGPFKEPPIKDLHISPFLTRDKPGASHRRVIVDLSFPHGHSVNSGVQSDHYLGTPFLLTLPTIDNITNQVKKLGKGCHLYKIDLSRAFRHVKLDPSDYNLLGLKLNDLYIDSCLPFGFRTGSALFQRLSDAVRFIMAQKGFTVTNYIDDVIGHSVVSKSKASFDALSALLSDLGFDISHKKIVEPATRVTCLGVDIDTVDFTVSIPPDKVSQILSECQLWLNRVECTKRQLQSLLGKLLYITKCVRISRPFLNRMLDLLRASDKFTKIILTTEFKQDLNWFLQFLPRFNGKAFISHRQVTEEIELDASLQGLGARWGQYVYTVPIPLGYKDFSIVHLEMLNILVAIRTWSHQWGGKAIKIACDNQAVVSVLNSGKTRDLTLAAIARNIFMDTAQADIMLKTVHIMGKVNEVADSLSRWTIHPYYRQKFRSLLPVHYWVNTPENATSINWCI